MNISLTLVRRLGRAVRDAIKFVAPVSAGGCFGWLVAPYVIEQPKIWLPVLGLAMFGGIVWAMYLLNSEGDE